MRILLVALLCLCACGANAFVASGSIPVPKTETVTANLGSPSYTIPNNFTGWSEEADDLIAGSFAGTTGASWCSLAGMLGSHGVLRIGGDGSDKSTAPALTQNLANGLASFVSCLGSGWTLIYGLDLCVNNTTTELTHAGYIVTAIGLSKVDFQFGNEPPECGLSNSAWATAWNSYYSALTGAYPTVKVDGPDAADSFHAGILAPLTSVGAAGLNLYTYHQYGLCCGTGFGGSGNYFSPPVVLATVNSIYNGWSKATSKDRLTETGTEVVGGEPGVSDRAVASAWYVDEAIWLANAGLLGINPHNYFSAVSDGRIGQAKYNAFVLQGDGGVAPAPPFYGMVLFSKLLGQRTVSITKSGTGNVNCLATIGTGGNANILCVNNDPYFPVTITFGQTGASWSTASVLDAQPASSAWCSDPNMLLGGQPIGEGGSWSGSWKTISNGDPVTIQPCGHAVAEIQP